MFAGDPGTLVLEAEPRLRPVKCILEKMELLDYLTIQQIYTSLHGDIQAWIPLLAYHIMDCKWNPCETCTWWGRPISVRCSAAG